MWTARFYRCCGTRTSSVTRSTQPRKVLAARPDLTCASSSNPYLRQARLASSACVGSSTTTAAAASPARSMQQPHLRLFASTVPAASGHNRWSKIRHRKGAADAARSAVFSRLTQEIHQSLRPPASFDPDSNPRLAAALAKAKDGGVPKVSIENCIARARAAAEGTGQSVTYEAVGPGGKEALIIECMTQNPARTVTRVKEVLNKHGCRISSVGFLFEKKGMITIQPIPGGFDDLFEVAVEHGAEDVRETEVDEEAIWEVITPPTSLGSVTSAISAAPQTFTIQSSELAYIPLDPLSVDMGGASSISEDRAEALDKVVQLLEDEADVVRVWTNVG